MCATPHKTKQGLFTSVFNNTCPRCRQGDMFIKKSAWQKDFMKMHDHCEVCGQPMEIETGFYYGTGYVSYALTVAISVATFIAWWVLIGFSIDDNRIFWWLGFNAVLLVASQRWLMRLSRRIWLGFFVRYDKNWKNTTNFNTERYNNNIHNAW